MSRRIRTAFIFALIVGVFLFLPAAAHATGTANVSPPTIRAWLEDTLLRVDAASNNIEAVYIDGSRVTYRVDGAFAVITRDYAGSGEYISVHAVDATGRASNVVQLSNPYYVKPTPKPSQKPKPPDTSQEPPLPPEEPQPLTPDGTGTTVDNVSDRDGKEFFTVETEEGNVFYLVIDHQRDSENVYLLNAVTESDLMALAEKDAPKPTATPAPTPAPPPPIPTPAPASEPDPEPAKPQGMNAGAVLLVVLAALGVGGAAYYVKILRPKQQAQAMDEDDGGEDAEGGRAYDDYGDGDTEDDAQEE